MPITTLERLRLVNWHNFEDTVIEIGNRCLGEYKLLKSQCEALINRALLEDFDGEGDTLAEEAKKYYEGKYSAGRRTAWAASLLNLLPARRTAIVLRDPMKTKKGKSKASGIITP